MSEDVKLPENLRTLQVQVTTGPGDNPLSAVVVPPIQREGMQQIDPVEAVTTLMGEVRGLQAERVTLVDKGLELQRVGKLLAKALAKAEWTNAYEDVFCGACGGEERTTGHDPGCTTVVALAEARKMGLVE